MDLISLETTAASCTDCELHKGRINPVFAKGNPNANILICGMVPADEENKLGLPFVGRAGQLLDQILKDVNLTLDNVYITNLVKCYLPAGLPLKQDWIEHCFPYLITQIGLIKPRVIFTLGKDATIGLLGLSDKTKLGSVRGKMFNYGSEIMIIPTYHPSYLLRGGGTNHRSYGVVLEDFMRAKNLGINF